MAGSQQGKKGGRIAKENEQGGHVFPCRYPKTGLLSFTFYNWSRVVPYGSKFSYMAFAHLKYNQFESRSAVGLKYVTDVMRKKEHKYIMKIILIL